MRPNAYSPYVHRRGILAALAALAGCVQRSPGGGDASPAGEDAPSLSSPAFDDGEPIPTRYAREGENVSPPLSIEGVPGDARSLALIVDDPDAPTAEPFVHWLCWNLPATTAEIPAGVPKAEVVGSLGGARQGTNGAGSIGYVGPAPPADDGPHTYRFTLSILDAELDLAPGSTRDALDGAMAGSILATARLTGTYDRG